MPEGQGWPTARLSVFFGAGRRLATLSDAVASGRIRRIALGVYTADLISRPEEIVAANRWAVIAALVPEALVADRTAADLPDDDGRTVFVVARRRRDLQTL